MKAYHRRGKAYLATKKYELAIKDFQYILEKEPDNKDMNACLMEARQKLTKEQEDKQPKVEEIADEEEKPKGFRRVAIESDSEEEGESENVAEDA